MIRIRSFFKKNQGFTPITPPNKQAGSAIVLIFVMIALFGALSFTVSKSMRGGGGKIDTEQAQLAAAEILSYARSVRSAVQELQINGCSDTEISFENSVVGGYVNPNAPTDKSCHVFDSNGGGLQYRAPDNKWQDPSKVGDTGYSEIYFVSTNIVTNLGEGSNDDLLLQVNWLKKSVCEEINNKIYSDKTITEDNAGFFRDSKAAGVFDTGSGHINLSTYSAHNAQPIACFTSQTYGGYYLYQALIIR